MCACGCRGRGIHDTSRKNWSDVHLQRLSQMLILLSDIAAACGKTLHIVKKEIRAIFKPGERQKRDARKAEPLTHRKERQVVGFWKKGVHLPRSQTRPQLKEGKFLCPPGRVCDGSVVHFSVPRSANLRGAYRRAGSCPRQCLAGNVYSRSPSGRVFQGALLVWPL